MDIEQKNEKNDIYDMLSQTFSNLSPQLVEMEPLLLPVKHASLDEETFKKQLEDLCCLIIAVVII